MNLLEDITQDSKVINHINLKEKTISYHEDIKQSNRKIAKIKGDEELVRAYLVTKLTKELGYQAKNIEFETEYIIGTPKTNKARIDIILRDDKGNPFLFIELKSQKEYEKDQDETIEKQLFNLATQEKGKGKKIKYLMLYSCNAPDLLAENQTNSSAKLQDNLEENILIIDYEKYPTFDDWKKKRSYINNIPQHYGIAKKLEYTRGGDRDLQKYFTSEQLTSLCKNLHNVLWGGGSTNDNDIFSALVNIILAKIQDENNTEKNYAYKFQNKLTSDGQAEEDEETLFERINNLYQDALKEKLYITNEKELDDVIVRKKFKLENLKYTVGKLEGYSFTEAKNYTDNKDILGDFFEQITRDGFKQTKGQFFTPINIVNFLLWGLQTDKLAIDTIKQGQRLPYMIDPSAGSGTFLISYMKFITENIKPYLKDQIENTKKTEEQYEEWFTPDYKENRWAKKYIYAVEHNFNLGTASKVNMILHGDGSSNIFVADGLSPFSQYKKEEEENILCKESKDDNYKLDNNSLTTNNQFDIIITNPPFSVETSEKAKKEDDKVEGRFLFGKSSSSEDQKNKTKKHSENLFIERYYQLLKENGRLGIVLPESVFDTQENTYIRLFIYKYFKIKAIVSLPDLAFEPHTKTKTSLLFAQKKTQSEIQDWNKLWDKYSTKWSHLKTRCEKLSKVYLEGSQKSRLPSIKNLTLEEEKEILVSMLKIYLDEDYSNEEQKKLTVPEIIKIYQDELEALCKADVSKIQEKHLGDINSWWVFGKVASEINYEIFMAEAEEIGYKRTKRGEKETKNELYRTLETEELKGKIAVDDTNDKGEKIYETILDYMRDITWN